jgi:hypothetical protein
VIVTLVGTDQRCDDPGELCLFGPLDRAALYRLLAQHLSQSSTGSFRAVKEKGDDRFLSKSGKEGRG